MSQLKTCPTCAGTGTVRFRKAWMPKGCGHPDCLDSHWCSQPQPIPNKPSVCYHQGGNDPCRNDCPNLLPGQEFGPGGRAQASANKDGAP